jgi:MFS transporter, Spinster family, sphingosine-1-phosphate transporter
VSVSGAASRDPAAFGRRLALSLLLVLTVINFLNYLDRYVLAAVLEQVAGTLDLSDSQSGLLGTVFMVVYMVFAPLGGYIGDRWNRNRLTAVAVALWSLATIGSGWVDDYGSLLTMRALVGIGEAGYATVAPAVIADLFRPAERGRRLALFYLAIPLGSALGYLLGGWVGHHFGWRAAFWVAGTPGLLFAVVAFMMPEPRRGSMDDGPLPAALPFVEGVRRVFRSPAWRLNTAGTTLMTFAMGGIAFWMPTYLQRVQQLDTATANTLFGGVTVVAGLVGTILGGHLGDRAQARGAGGYFRVSGTGLLLGAPFAAAMPYATGLPWVFGCVFAAELLLFLNTGPLNAALVACVPANLRASAVAINVFFIHALGDAISPFLIGAVSEASTISFAIAATAVPIALGGGVLWVGALRIGRLEGGLAAVDS